MQRKDKDLSSIGLAIEALSDKGKISKDINAVRLISCVWLWHAMIPY